MGGQEKGGKTRSRESEACQFGWLVNKNHGSTCLLDSVLESWEHTITSSFFTSLGLQM